MSTKSHISLIDLNKQLPFQIDDEIKEKICFDETLVVSCCHHEGSREDFESSDDDDSDEEQQSAADENTAEESEAADAIEIKDYVPDEEKPEEIPDKDFLFYFFPDCTLPPPPQGSKATLIIEDGIPRLNPEAPTGAAPPGCTCGVDKKGECDCFYKYPCDCASELQLDCTCDKLDNICICGPEPKLVCTCKESEVCLCYDHKPKPTCSCDKIQKPCICGEKYGRFPCPVCKCVTRFDEPIGEEEEIRPCDCQMADCECKQGKTCICGEDNCFCAFKETCICGPPAVPKDGEGPLRDLSESVCSCDVSKTCVCGDGPDECVCRKPKDCICGDPDDCKCNAVCTCDTTCVCDAHVEQEINPCDCTKIPLNEEVKCTCRKKKEKNVLKKIATKEGYRWCHQVDSHHTFFDYGYGMHHKIEYKEPYEPGVKIIDAALAYEAAELAAMECKIHGKIPPKFAKKIKRPCLDCCSAVGGISISVETLGEEKGKFLVQSVSHASKEGAKTGSRLVSIIDCNLHTMEENRTEHIVKKGVIKERRSYMGIGENGYYNKVSKICGEKTVTKRIYRSFEDSSNFLLEGANFVLMRYFALVRYRGMIRTDTVMIGGEICQSIYNSLGVSQGVVNGKPMFVVKVERHIIEPNGRLHQTLTVLSLRGYIVSHEWADNCYVLHINPLLSVIPERDIIEEHAPLREKWREDMQLFSDYLEMKSERTSEGGKYITENGRLSNLIRDYLQTVLMLKPSDTLHFTQHYFSSMLSSLDLPHNEYFDPCSKHVRYYFFEE